VLARIASTDKQRCCVDIEITGEHADAGLGTIHRKTLAASRGGDWNRDDDFGTGYSSLRLLARLPVDTLKVIVRSQSIAIPQRRDPGIDHRLAGASLQYAHRRGRCGDHRAAGDLRSMKCDVAQGYLFGRPTPASDVVAAIARLSQAAGGPEYRSAPYVGAGYSAISTNLQAVNR